MTWTSPASRAGMALPVVAVATDKGLCMDIRQKRSAVFAAPALDPDRSSPLRCETAVAAPSAQPSNRTKTHDEARDIRDRQHLRAGEAALDARSRQGAGNRRGHAAERPANSAPGAVGGRALRPCGRPDTPSARQAT